MNSKPLPTNLSSGLLKKVPAFFMVLPVYTSTKQHCGRAESLL